MTKKWKDLPANGDEKDQELSPVEMLEGLNSVVAEWITEEARDESVRIYEYPLLKQIKLSWKKGVFGNVHTRSMRTLLKNYVRCGYDQAGVKIACEILGQSPEELRTGALAAAQENKKKKG